MSDLFENPEDLFSRAVAVDTSKIGYLAGTELVFLLFSCAFGLEFYISLYQFPVLLYFLYNNCNC